MLRLAVTVVALQAGFHGFTASLPLALARAGLSDPAIGVIVGIAALVQIPAAFIAGALIDRFGGVRLVLAGGGAYLAASAILLLPGVEPGGHPLAFVVARIGQGVGLATVLPASLSLVPRLVDETRQGFGLAFIGSAHNIALICLPPISLAVLAAWSFNGVALTVTGFVVIGLVLAVSLPRLLWARTDPTPGGGDPLSPRRRRFGLAFRRSWAGPLAIILLYVVHWGVITAYLPQRADAVGADVGLFFVADGLAVLALRVPSGWLADRIELRRLLLAGLGLTFAAIALLLPSPTTPLLVAAGILTGAGAGLIMTPVLVELSRRSDDTDRGSAFALFSGSLATAIAIGSVAVAPLVAGAGFEAAISAALSGLGAAALLALRERSTRPPARAAVA